MNINNQQVLERCIIQLYNRQTETEQVCNSTHIWNGVGFNKFDAKMMTYYAKWILSGKHLTGKFIEDAKRRIMKYRKQL